MSKTLELAKISKKYAEALYKSVDSDKQKTLEELYAIAEIVNSNPEFNNFIENPRITFNAKDKLIDEAFKSKVSEKVFNTLKVLLNKRRFQVVNKLAEDFKALLFESQNIEVAKVISAKTLKEEQIKQIKQELETILKKTLEIESAIDESLIAGIKVEIGDDKVLDASVNSKLKQMKQLLTN